MAYLPSKVSSSYFSQPNDEYPSSAKMYVKLFVKLMVYHYCEPLQGWWKFKLFPNAEHGKNKK